MANTKPVFIMALLKAQSTIQLLGGSVAVVTVDPKKSYQINPSINAQNIRMGMIAVPEHFPENPNYYHRVFEFGANNSFQWQASSDGTDFAKIYFYGLLPWAASQASLPSPPPDMAWDVGVGDGEQGLLPLNKATTITVDLKATSDGAPQYQPTYKGMVLPADFIGLADGYKVSVSSKETPDGKQLNWAQVNVLEEEVTEHLRTQKAQLIEERTQIYAVSSSNKEDITAFLSKGHPGPYSVSLAAAGTPDDTIDLIALISPRTDPSDPFDFEFYVGDPEKNGRVTIQNI